MNLNEEIFSWLRGLATGSALLSFIGSVFGYYLPYLMGIGVLLFVVKKKGLRDKTLAFLQIIFIGILSRFILFPLADVIAGRTGFPSASAAFFFTISFALWIFRKKWGMFFTLLSLLNAAGLIMVGADSPADIAGGLALAAISFFIFKVLFVKKNEIIPEGV